MKAIIILMSFTIVAGASDLGNTGAIRGTVKNADNGELLPMSLLFLFSNDNSLPARSFLSRSGHFTMIGVPSGHYRAFVSREGFRSTLAQEVYVKADTVTELDLWLKPIKTRSDSTDVVRPGKPGVDYKMKYLTPDAKKFR